MCRYLSIYCHMLTYSTTLSTRVGRVVITSYQHGIQSLFAALLLVRRFSAFCTCPEKPRLPLPPKSPFQKSFLSAFIALVNLLRNPGQGAGKGQGRGRDRVLSTGLAEPCFFRCVVISRSLLRPYPLHDEI